MKKLFLKTVVSLTIISFLLCAWFIYSQFLLPSSKDFPTWHSANTKIHLPEVAYFYLNAAEKQSLLVDFELNSFLPQEAKNDLELLHAIIRWASSRWKHVGDNDPGTTNPLLILQQAKAGKRFRCVEFGEITVAAASAIGLPARVLKLRRKDVETAQADAGHVAAEVWLRDLGKWVFVDSQWGIIPLSGSMPLSASELAIALKDRSSDLKFYSAKESKIDQFIYPSWIAPYLYFIEYEVDQRLNLPTRSKNRISLSPVGVAAPRYFQRHLIEGEVFQTSDVSVFEQSPRIDGSKD